MIQRLTNYIFNNKYSIFSGYLNEKRALISMQKKKNKDFELVFFKFTDSMLNDLHIMYSITPLHGAYRLENRVNKMTKNFNENNQNENNQM